MVVVMEEEQKNPRKNKVKRGNAKKVKLGKIEQENYGPVNTRRKL